MNQVDKKRHQRMMSVHYLEKTHSPQLFRHFI